MKDKDISLKNCCRTSAPTPVAPPHAGLPPAPATPPRAPSRPLRNPRGPRVRSGQSRGQAGQVSQATCMRGGGRRLVGTHRLPRSLCSRAPRPFPPAASLAAACRARTAPPATGSGRAPRAAPAARSCAPPRWRARARLVELPLPRQLGLDQAPPLLGRVDRLAARAARAAPAKPHLAVCRELRDERAVPARASALLFQDFVLALGASGPDDFVPVTLAHELGGAARRARHPGDEVSLEAVVALLVQLAALITLCGRALHQHTFVRHRDVKLPCDCLSSPFLDVARRETAVAASHPHSSAVLRGAVRYARGTARFPHRDCQRSGGSQSMVPRSSSSS